MAGLPTISRGIGYGPLSTISRGLLGGLDLTPGIALALLASPSVALVVAAGTVLLVQGQGAIADVVAATGAGTIPAAPGAATVSPAPSTSQ